MEVRLGVDIGGTFTDVVLESPKGLTSIKVLTTYAAPENAIIEGMNRVCERAGVPASASPAESAAPSAPPAAPQVPEGRQVESLPAQSSSSTHPGTQNPGLPSVSEHVQVAESGGQSDAEQSSGPLHDGGPPSTSSPPSSAGASGASETRSPGLMQVLVSVSQLQSSGQSSSLEHGGMQ